MDRMEVARLLRAEAARLDDLASEDALSTYSMAQRAIEDSYERMAADLEDPAPETVRA